MTLNPSTNSGLSPVKLMLIRKMKSMFNKLLSKENQKQMKKKSYKNHIYKEKTFSLKSTETGKKSGRLVSLMNVLGD